MTQGRDQSSCQGRRDGAKLLRTGHFGEDSFRRRITAVSKDLAPGSPQEV
jgi:hypothetical protein